MINVALSLRQPWAWAVLHAGKTIENRKWNTAFRGPFLIHAAQGWDPIEYKGAVAAIEDAANPGVVVPPIEEMFRGGIVGSARVLGVLPPRRSDQRTSFVPDYEAAHAQKLVLDADDLRWHFPEQHGFVLADVEELPFVRTRGMLNFFKVSDWAAKL